MAAAECSNSSRPARDMMMPILTTRLLRVALPVLTLSLTGAANAAPFCPFKLPGEGKMERYLNLTVVQYIDVGDDVVLVSYGGGNFGAGHELRIKVPNRAEGLEWLRKMGEAAKACDASPGGAQGAGLPGRAAPTPARPAAS